MIDGDADGTRHQCENEGRDDAGVRDGIFQTGEASAENKEQQRHHSHGREGGASGQYNAGSRQDATLLDMSEIVHAKQEP